jgi:cytochrome c
MRQITVLALAAGLSWMPLAQAQDTAAAEALIKKSGCLKCHSVSADKDGPSFKKTAAKYKGQADAADKLQKFLSAGGKHPVLKADDGQKKNVAAYILSR